MRESGRDSKMPGSGPQHSGFTLLEIMVVVVIIGILAALVVPKIISRPDEARVIAAKQDIATLLQSLKLYRLDNQRYPTTEQGLQALVTKPTSLPLPRNWKSGGYL
ncbi:MAG: ral secretion pathway protein, partial [Betaproteobacteria bacterium]|nr:ral secretion pathway protein [Betaproteobacteria bacterium]